MRTDRRTFLTSTAASTLIVACAGHTPAPAAEHGTHEDEVTPVEDLMREHGVLRRVMFLYDEASVRLESGRELPLDALASCAAIVRRVIEQYHEQLEEQHLFPVYEKAGKLADLTAVLRRQHAAGRQATDQIVALTGARLADADRARLASVLRGFNHMYRAHAAREDTVLFPALRELVGDKAYGELGEKFEDEETKMLGEHGFEHAVADVAKLEQAFGVADLGTLTYEPRTDK